MNINEIKDLINAVSNSDIWDFQYEEKGVKLALSKGNITAVENVVEKKIVTDEEPTKEVTEDSYETVSPVVIEGKKVTSPLVGTVYMAPAEDEEPFVSVGDTVKKGQTLAIVEAMKLMNEIESEFDGVVKEICVENESPVEFGQTLFVIE